MNKQNDNESILRERGIVSASISLFLYILILFAVAIPLTFIDIPTVLLIILNFVITGGLTLLVFHYILGIPGDYSDLREFFINLKILDVKEKTNGVLIGIAGGIFIIANLIIINQLSPNLTGVDFDALWTANTYSAFFPVTAAVWEEVVFRGIILSLLIRKYDRVTSITLDGLLFGLAHGLNILFGQSVIVSIHQFIIGFAFGVLFSYIVLETENLWPVIILHYLNNAFSPVFASEIYSNESVAWDNFLLTNLSYIFSSLAIGFMIYLGKQQGYLGSKEEPSAG